MNEKPYLLIANKPESEDSDRYEVYKRYDSDYQHHINLSESELIETYAKLATIDLGRDEKPYDLIVFKITENGIHQMMGDAYTATDGRKWNDSDEEYDFCERLEKEATALDKLCQDKVSAIQSAKHIKFVQEQALLEKQRLAEKERQKLLAIDSELQLLRSLKQKYPDQ